MEVVSSSSKSISFSRHDLWVKSGEWGSGVYPEFAFHTCTMQQDHNSNESSIIIQGGSGAADSDRK